MSHLELFQAIEDKLASHNQTLVISIDGRAGAGKTTLANQLAKSFPGTQVIHMDDLYRGWALTLGQNLTRELQSILDQLADQGEVTYVKFDWLQNNLGDKVIFAAPKILVLEGVGSGQSSISDSVDISVWIEVSQEIGLSRVLERDGAQITEEMRLFILEQETHFTAEGTQERSDFQLSGN